MLRFLYCVLVSVLPLAAFCQQDTTGVDAATLQRALQVLASDSLKGRGNFSPELKKAALFIQASFMDAGLNPYFPSGGYLQFFTKEDSKEQAVAVSSAENYDPEKVLANVVGVLPGKTKPEEIVIFSAHYDHLGAERGSSDRIFNGANDNASGTAAMLALAQYFGKEKSNDRTLVFCAFAGEELGLLGSELFAGGLNKKNVVAVINLEMLGRTGAAGVNNFFITGTRYSNLPDIFKKNLAGQPVKIRREQYSEYGDLFLRSDNYPFAKRGIPAHTIMSSDDSEPCYHRPCDDWKSINEQHLLNVTNAIIKATATLVNGTERPKVYSIPD